MKKYTSIDQRGASAIMVTMFFIIMITLITVGYSTIVRREQSATLDRNLASQAQYAAESGINSARAYFDKMAAAGQTITDNSSCDPLSSLAGDIAQPYTPKGMYSSVKTNYGSTVSSAVKNTCITWNTPVDYKFDLASFGSNSFILENNPAKNTAWDYSFNLTWGSKDGTGDVYDGSGNPTMPGLSGNNVSIIKGVIVGLDEITNSDALQVFYLVPTNLSGSDIKPNCTTSGCTARFADKHVDLGNYGVGNVSAKRAQGVVYYVPCNTRPCSVLVGGLRWPDLSVRKPQGIYFENIGAKTSTVTFAPGAPANNKPLNGAVERVDSNAVVQDTSKRLVADVKLQPQTWQPWFAALGESLCKDYRVDGNLNNGDLVHNNSSNSCPN